MWQALNTVTRKLTMFWNEVEEFTQNMRGLLSDRLRGQDKAHTTTDESYVSSDDSGFADDELLPCNCSDAQQYSSTQYKDSEIHSDDCELDDNDFVMDSDLKNKQRITLMSLLYSRALDRKLNEIRAKKSSYSLREKEHSRKYK